MTNNTSVARRKVLKATSAGVASATGIAMFAGTASAHCTADDCFCEKLGKIDKTPEVGDTFTFTCSTCDGVQDHSVEVTDVKTNDAGDVICADVRGFDPEPVFCKAVVKGGNETKVYECGDGNFDNEKATDLCAPENPNNDKLYEVSHITLYICDFPG